MSRDCGVCVRNGATSQMRKSPSAHSKSVAVRVAAAISCRCTCSESLRSPACCATTPDSESVRSAPLVTTEAALIQSFFGMIDRHTPQMVSWNGSCFDLPVLHYRGLLAGVSAQRYWELGADDPEFRYNNYIGRYHTRHIDLMDVLSMYQSRASAPLDVLSKLAGYPGKLGMDGSQVWQAYRDGQIERIRSYCETDVVNTYLVVQSLSENARRA